MLAVNPLWSPNLMKDMQTEQLPCWSGMTDTEHSTTSSSNEEDLNAFLYGPPILITFCDYRPQGVEGSRRPLCPFVWIAFILTSFCINGQQWDREGYSCIKLTGGGEGISNIAIQEEGKVKVIAICRRRRERLK